MNYEIKTGTIVTVSQDFPTFQVFGIDGCQISTRELTKFASNYKKIHGEVRILYKRLFTLVSYDLIAFLGL